MPGQCRAPTWDGCILLVGAAAYPRRSAASRSAGNMEFVDRLLLFYFLKPMEFYTLTWSMQKQDSHRSCWSIAHLNFEWSIDAWVSVCFGKTKHVRNDPDWLLHAEADAVICAGSYHQLESVPPEKGLIPLCRIENEAGVTWSTTSDKTGLIKIDIPASWLIGQGKTHMKWKDDSLTHRRYIASDQGDHRFPTKRDTYYF